MKLHLSDDLSLPLDAVTQKLAFLGRTGSGKTYAATKVAEEMLGFGDGSIGHAQIVALDPVGVWWGLRLAADGKSPGISIPVFGGLHGDVPLEPTAGKLIADLVVDRAISAVLDVSQFESDSAKARFARDFADRFFFRKKAAPSAVHVFLEECQEFVPQNIMRGDEQMLHAFTRLIKLGRNFGVGASLISQRPQEVNKKALNMTECLLAFQMTGPHERKTVESWIAEKGLDLDIVADLPKLAVGTAHVWSPAWLRVSKTVKVAAKRTFNASSTPEVGKRAQSRALAPIDLEQLRERMAETIERAKADDPKELRKRIAEAERQRDDIARNDVPNWRRMLALVGGDESYGRGRIVDELEKRLAKPKVERVEVPALTTKQWGRLEQIADSAADLTKTIRELIDNRAARDRSLLISEFTRTDAPVHPPTPASTPRQVVPVAPRQPVRRAAPASANGRDHSGQDMPRMRRSILTALAQHPKGLTKAQILLFAGYAASGKVSAEFAELSREGFIDASSPIVTITGLGLIHLGDFDPLPTGAELRSKLIGESSAMEAAILGALFDSYPEPLQKSEILKRAGYAASGKVSAAFARIVRMSYAEPTGPSLLRASEELFS